MAKNVFAGVGMAKGEKKDSAKVGADAVKIAVENLKKKGGKIPGSFGLLFCSVKYDLQELVASAHKEFGETPWIGCTTVGELSSNSFSTESCVAMIVSSDYIHVGIGVGDNAFNKPKEAGRISAKKALKNMKMDKEVDPYVQYLAMKRKNTEQIIKMTPYTGILLTPGPTMVEPLLGDDVIMGITEILGNNVPIVGGSAGDDFTIKGSYQFANGKIYNSSAVFMLGLFNVEKEIEVEHGFQPTNDILVVTKSKEYLVEKVNNKPAAKEIGNILGTNLYSLPKSDYAKKVMKFTMPSLMKFFKKMGFDMTEAAIQKILSSPFGIQDMYGNYWLRTPYQAQGDSVIFGNKIPNQTVMRRMEIEQKKLVEIDKAIYKNSISPLKDPAFIIQFNCCGRRLLAGDNANRRIIKSNKEIFEKYPLIGFYSNGEYGFKNKLNMHFSTTNVVFAVGNKLLSK